MKALVCINLCYAVAKNTSVIYCYNWKSVIRNIESRSKDFDFVFILNDRHRQNDEEFKTIPPHCIDGSTDCFPLDINLRCNNIQYIYKKELNVFANKHIYSTLLCDQYNLKEITLGGFVGSLDIIESLKDSTIGRFNISIYENLIGDFNQASLNNTIEEIKKIGIMVE